MLLCVFDNYFVLSARRILFIIQLERNAQYLRERKGYRYELIANAIFAHIFVYKMFADCIMSVTIHP